MLNSNNERELAYIVKVDAITPMNADRLECAHVGGWHCVVGKGEFQAGDLAVYFEIDSKLPEVFPFNKMEFLKSKHFAIKSQKIRGEVSQGLLMPLSAWTDSEGRIPAWVATVNLCIASGSDILKSETRFLTKELSVTYAVSEDNQRKASSGDKYKRMAQRRSEIFRHKWAQWFMRRIWGKRLMFLFFGKKKDKKTGWPAWVVKTDEERCQNMPWLFNGSDEKWIATEKIDGTSTTFTLRGNPKKAQFYVCSRNVVFDKPDKKCFYETNVYTEMAETYHMEPVMRTALAAAQAADPNVDFLTIQAETYGQSVQKRDYGMDYHDMKIFNIIWGFKNGTTKRLNPMDGMAQASVWGLPYVPVVDTGFVLPATCEELLAMAGGASKVDGGMREGLVLRSVDGKKSFKAVSQEYLLKYHS